MFKTHLNIQLLLIMSKSMRFIRRNKGGLHLQSAVINVSAVPLCSKQNSVQNKVQLQSSQAQVSACKSKRSLQFTLQLSPSQDFMLLDDSIAPSQIFTLSYQGNILRIESNPSAVNHSQAAKIMVNRIRRVLLNYPQKISELMLAWQKGEFIDVRNEFMALNIRHTLEELTKFMEEAVKSGEAMHFLQGMLFVRRDELEIRCSQKVNSVWELRDKKPLIQFIYSLL